MQEEIITELEEVNKELTPILTNDVLDDEDFKKIIIQYITDGD